MGRITGSQKDIFWPIYEFSRSSKTWSRQSARYSSRVRGPAMRILAQTKKIWPKYEFSSTPLGLLIFFSQQKIIEILCDGGQDNTPECMAAYMAAHDTPAPVAPNNRGYLVWAIIGTCVSAVLAIAVVVLAANVVKMKNQTQYTPLRS